MRVVVRTIVPLLLALVASPAAAGLDDFARCLTRAHARYYTASWCPHCRAQNEMFGSALRYVDVVDCTHGCRDVHSLPTWIFGDGSRTSGVQRLDQLAARTGCPIDGARRDSAPSGPSAHAIPARDRLEGGARIIEIPARR